MAKKRKSVKDMSHLEVMKGQDTWGLWPYLPIKRHVNHEVECCLLWAYKTFVEGNPPIPVFGASVYRLPETSEKFLATKKYEYANLEAVVADGWVVDD